MTEVKGWYADDASNHSIMSTSKKIVNMKSGRINEAIVAAKRHFFAPKNRIILAEIYPLAKPPKLSIKKLCVLKITLK
jgi:hypothetical protein